MPIEFFCPACGQRVRTPEPTAGRKGRCPQCGIKVRIPDQSLVLENPRHTPTEVVAIISLQCSGCYRTLSVPREQAGKQGQCPHCGQLTIISPVSQQVNLQFVCPHCAHTVRVGEMTAGQQGKCPYCAQVVTVPTGEVD